MALIPEEFMSSPDYIDAMANAYQAWFGTAPDQVLRLKRGVPGNGPAEMGVVIFLPEDSAGGSTRTMLGTAGMSAKDMHGPVAVAELGIEIEGRLPSEALNCMAQRLADVATVPFQTGRGYTLKSVLRYEGGQIFRGFDAAYLFDWDPYGKLVPPGFDKEVPLLRIVPLFNNEALLIEKSTDRHQTYLSLKRKGLTPHDLNRNAIET